MDTAEIDHILAAYPAILTVADVAAIIRVHPRSVQRWAKQGHLPAIRAGRTYRIARADLRRWLISSSAPASSAGASTPGRH